MATNYTWGFGNPDCIISQDGMSQIVQTIHWNLTGEREGASGYVYGTCGLGTPDPKDFTPYNELTEDWFIGQVEENSDMDSIYASIDSQIENELHPTMDSPALPWATPIVTTKRTLDVEDTIIVDEISSEE